MITFIVGLTIGLILGTLLGLFIAGMAQARAEQQRRDHPERRI